MGWSSINYCEDYKKLVGDLIRKIIEICSANIIPSSSIYGAENYDLNEDADFHYGGVWTGGR